MNNVERQEALEGIAIIGMAGRFPGARNIENFWRNLKDGVESISFFSEQELKAEGVDPALLSLPAYVRAKAIIDDIDLFDATFFGFTPREAELTDPQHRLFLECAWEALENAGYVSDNYDGSIAVFAGSTWSTYLFNLLSTAGERDFVDSFRVLLGNDKDHLPNWVSYKLNLKGPSVNVQTTCSTSLAAVHLACQSLLSYQCDMALAGGVTINVPQKVGYLFQEGGIGSPDGHCRAFDAKAGGSVGGEGVGIVVLKRLDEALAAGDTIHAVVKGSAINNDGSAKVNYTAPSVDGQYEVIAMAMAVAGVEPETISYIETHGSGTPLGDPIEVAALSQAYQGGAKKNCAALGSVKTNIGHTGAAAGVAGLIKTVLALNHKFIPPSLHFQSPNPHIDFDNSPFYVNARLTDWPSNGLPRRAGVSSFGIGGTNVHSIIEEAPEPESSGPSRSWQLLSLSAKTGAALETATDNLAAHLRLHPDHDLADIAYTLQVGRKAFDYRRMLVCRDHGDAIQSLAERSPGRIFDGMPAMKDRPIAFMFPGLGDHYVNMGLELYRAEVKFREQMDICCDLLKPHLGMDLRDVLYPGAEDPADNASAQTNAAPSGSRPSINLRKMLSGHDARPDDATRKLNQTNLAQPALFAIEYALASLFMEWGISPRAMIGYSIGEYVAACLAGVFSLEDAIRLVAKRAQLIQELAEGAMLAVSLQERELRALLNDHLSIAGVNGPALCVVSGAPEAVASLELRLNEKQIVCKRLPTTHAFHSNMMGPIAETFAALIKSVELNVPSIPYVSNVTGAWITPAEATDPNYWVRHLCGAVRFSDGIQTLSLGEGHLFLEVGPGQMLCSLVIQQAQINKGKERVALTSMRHAYDRQSDVALLQNTLGQLWLEGAPVDWLKFYAGDRRRRLPLPTYPFERRRYWVERVSSLIDGPDIRRVATGRRQGVADWFYIPSWKRSLAPDPKQEATSAAESLCWLILADDHGFGSGLAERLGSLNQKVITAAKGPRFEQLSDCVYTINAQKPEDYHLLLEALSNADCFPARVLLLWPVEPLENDGHSGPELFLIAQNSGFNSLLYLAQAIGERSAEKEIHIGVVSTGIHDVTGVEELSPEKATVLVLGKSISQAYHQIICRYIDIASIPAGRRDQRLLNQIISEMSLHTSGEIIAYRGRHRWIRDYQAVKWGIASGIPSCLRHEGVYLITGGLTGIGAVLAEYLVKTVRAKCLLLAHPDFPSRESWPASLADDQVEESVRSMIRKIRDLEEIGGEIAVINLEGKAEEAIRRAIDLAYERYGRLHGVFHTAETAAAKPIGGSLAAKSIEDAQHYQAKVFGVYSLDQALQGREVDFCFLFSSLTAILGGSGSLPYEAANSFLDVASLARAHVTTTRWVSVNWDDSATAEEAANVFHQILSSDSIYRLVVSSVDLTSLLQRNDRGNMGQNGAAPETEMARTATLHARPSLTTPYVAPAGPIEQKVAEIWRELLGVESIGSHDNFFHLGGNSLVGIKLTTLIHRAFEVNIPIQAIFVASTVHDLALVIEDSLLTEIEGLGAMDDGN